MSQIFYLGPSFYLTDRVIILNSYYEGMFFFH